MVKNKNGFTIVELLIVIVIIGILAAITVVAYNGITARARDTERNTDMNAIDKSLTMYRVLNGHYPFHNDLFNNDEVWVLNNLEGINSETIHAPGQTNNSLLSTQNPRLFDYGIKIYTTDGSICKSPDFTVNECTKYKMWWRREATDEIVMFQSKYGW